MNSYTRVRVIVGITLLTTLGATLVQQAYAAIEDGAQIRETTQTFEQKKD